MKTWIKPLAATPDAGVTRYLPSGLDAPAWRVCAKWPLTQFFTRFS